VQLAEPSNAIGDLRHEAPQAPLWPP
jgi:hypothetical protein